MSSHEIFMNVYAKDHQSARLQAAQSHRQVKSGQNIPDVTSAWRRPARILTQAAWALVAYWRIGVTSHAG